MCPFEQSIFQLVALIHHHQVLTYKKHDGGMGEVGAIIHKEIPKHARVDRQRFAGQ